MELQCHRQHVKSPITAFLLKGVLSEQPVRSRRSNQDGNHTGLRERQHQTCPPGPQLSSRLAEGGSR